jgi:hypothetical protein
MPAPARGRSRATRAWPRHLPRIDGDQRVDPRLRAREKQVRAHPAEVPFGRTEEAEFGVDHHRLGAPQPASGEEVAVQQRRAVGAVDPPQLRRPRDERRVAPHDVGRFDQPRRDRVEVEPVRRIERQREDTLVVERPHRPVREARGLLDRHSVQCREPARQRRYVVRLDARAAVQVG